MTRQCPNLGRYEIVSFRPPNAENIENILTVDSEQNGVINAELNAIRIPTTPFPPSQCHHNSVRRMDIGCRTPDRMEFALSCSDEALSGKDHHYLTCHFAFRENCFIIIALFHLQNIF